MLQSTYVHSMLQLRGLSCQTWWWPYRKEGPKHVVYFLTPYTLIKFCCVLTYPSYQLWFSLQNSDRG